MGIFVSILIKGGIDEVWARTQDPKLHERWDLRFTQIDYLPKAADEPQRFLYQTRLGFGIRVAGEGESITTKDVERGCRTSSLRFWSDQAHSLIREGSGYWKYSPEEQGTRFETGYDYKTRLGIFGRFFDLAVFRPLIAWATAWSFDALRRWIEDGQSPELGRQKAVIHALARGTLAFVWIWHGLVPKLLAHDPTETLPLLRLGMTSDTAVGLVHAAAYGELVMGLATLVLWTWRPILLFEAVSFLALGTGATLLAPEMAGWAFNPVTLTLCLVALCLIGFVAGKDLPSAKNCVCGWRRKI